MTCVIGLVEDGIIYMGADSLGSDEYWNCNLYDDKLFINGEYIFGGAGSYREGNILEVTASLPNPPKDEDELRKFMYEDFVNAIRNDFLQAGVTFDYHNFESTDASFLIGVKGQLFQMDENFGILQCKRSYDAIGCGGPIALGSLHATEEYDIGPEERIMLALKAAEAFSAGVRGPFQILKLEEE